MKCLSLSFSRARVHSLFSCHSSFSNHIYSGDTVFYERCEQYWASDKLMLFQGEKLEVFQGELEVFQVGTGSVIGELQVSDLRKLAYFSLFHLLNKKCLQIFFSFFSVFSNALTRSISSPTALSPNCQQSGANRKIDQLQQGSRMRPPRQTATVFESMEAAS